MTVVNISDHSRPSTRRSLSATVKLVCFIKGLQASVRAKREQKALVTKKGRLSKQALRAKIDAIALKGTKGFLPRFSVPPEALFWKINHSVPTTAGPALRVAASNSLLLLSSPKLKAGGASKVHQIHEIQETASCLNGVRGWSQSLSDDINLKFGGGAIVGPNPKFYNPLFLANLEHLLLRHLGFLLDCLNTNLWAHLLLTAAFSSVLSDGRFWSEYKDRRRVRSTTWPWNIKPSLVVLWGVCWQFETYPPKNVPRTSQIFTGEYDDLIQNKSSLFLDEDYLSPQLGHSIALDAVSGVDTAFSAYASPVQRQSYPAAVPYGLYSRNFEPPLGDAPNFEFPGDQTYGGSLEAPGIQQAYSAATEGTSLHDSFAPSMSHSSSIISSTTGPTYPAASAILNYDYSLSPGPPGQYLGLAANTYSPPSPLAHAGLPEDNTRDNPATQESIESWKNAVFWGSSQEFPESSPSTAIPRLHLQTSLQVPTVPTVTVQTPTGSSPQRVNLSSPVSPRYLPPDWPRRHEPVYPEQLPDYSSQAANTNMVMQHADQDDKSPTSLSAGSISNNANITSGRQRNESPPIDANGHMYCDKCTSHTTFKRKCEWHKHMDRHERPYKCTEATCTKLKGFTYSGGLARHLREVHNDKGGPKEILYCPYRNCKRSEKAAVSGTGPKGFTRKENLNEHIRRVHTSEGSDGGDAGDNIAAIENEHQPSEVEQYQYQHQQPATSRRRKRSTAGFEDGPSGDDPESLKHQIKRLRQNDERKDQQMREMQSTLESMKAFLEQQQQQQNARAGGRR